MPRLIDDIRAQHRFEMPWFVQRQHERAWAEHCSRLLTLLEDQQLPVVLIDNVADWYYSSEQEFWDLRKDFPNVAPPFATAWYEHKMPRTIHSREMGDSDIASLGIGKGRTG